MKTFSISLFSIIILTSLSLNSQTITPRALNYTIEDGLPSNEIYHSIQDRRGYMWFSSDNGLIKYDGYKFKTYEFEKGLSERIVFFLQETNDGKIWMNSLSGDFYYYEAKLDTIIPYQHNDLLKKYNYDQWVSKYYIDKNDDLYIPHNNNLIRITSAGIIEKIDLGDSETMIIKTFDDNKTLSTKPNYKGITTTINKYINETIVVIKDSINTKHSFEFINTNRPHYLRNLSLQLSTGHLLLSNCRNSIYILKDSTRVTVKIEKEIISMTSTNDGSIFLCLGNKGGLRKYKDVNDLIANKYILFNAGITVSHMTEDRAGGLWITTQSKGVTYIPNQTTKTIHNNILDPNDHIVQLKANTEQTEAYFCSSNGIIGSLNLSNYKTKVLYRLDDYIIKFYYEPVHKKIWISTSKKILIYDVTTDTKKELNLFAKSIRSDSIGNVYISKINAAYILNGKDYTTIKSWKLGAYKFKRFYDFFKTKNGTKYITTITGLFKLENDSLVNQKNEHEYFRKSMFSVDQLSNGILLFRGRARGLLIKEPNNYFLLDDKNGLISNSSFNAYIDHKDNIWLSSYKGLTKIFKKENGTYGTNQYTTKTGLPSNIIFDVIVRENNIIVSSGANLIEMNLDSKTLTPSPPFIEYFSIDNGKSKKKVTDILEFNYEQNNIKIAFISIDFSQVGKIEYRYRFQKTENWKRTFNTSIYLSFLQPGEYQFEVQSSNSRGEWSIASKQQFKIMPPWWDQNWIKALGLIFMILIFYSAYTYKTNQLKTDHQHKIKVNEMENKFLRTQMNPHFIFNALNSISYFIKKNDKEKATNFLSDFSSLIRFNLNATKRKLVPIIEELKALKSLLELETERFPNKFKYHFNIDPTIDLELFMLPPMLLQPIVENALIHGLFHLKNNKGLLNIEINHVNLNTILISIQDNGVGRIAAEKLEQKHKKMSGIGLENIKERIQLINGSNPDWYIQFEINDGPNDGGTEAKFLFTENL